MRLKSILYGCLFVVLSYTSTFALDAINPTGPDHLAIRGTDPTAYFNHGAPKSGNAEFSVKWKGATWYFISQKEAELFRANPHAFSPQFGAYCTGGLAAQHVVEGKPQYWRLFKGKLYLFHTKAGAQRFSNAPLKTIQKAKAYWDTLDVKN